MFSGGSASNLLAQRLENLDAEIVNVIGVFDNGGSTGALRRIVSLPAMGDIRNRLSALAPAATTDQRAVKALFDLRFSERKAEKQLRDELRVLANGEHHLIANLPASNRNELLEAIKRAKRELPAEFSLRELSVGNLLIFGRTLQANDFLGAVEWARKLLSVRSHVLPVTEQSVHLGALCANGHWVLGQAALTSEQLTLPSAVKSLHLIDSENSFAFEPKVEACTRVIEYLQKADAFIVGFGSFLSSILPHFLVRGIGREFVGRTIPKMLVCNPTADKETADFTVATIASTINAYAGKDARQTNTQSPAFTHILHFGFSGESRIPPGDIEHLKIRYLDLQAAGTFPAMADEVCHTVSSSLSLARVKGQKRTRPIPIVMLDLDGTLFDYTGLRIKATAAVLEGMVRDPTAVSTDLVDVLRPPLTDVLAALGFADLRRQWDSPDVLVFGHLLEQPSIREILLSLLKAADLNDKAELDATFAEKLAVYRYSENLRSSTATGELLGAIAKARSRFESSLEKRALEFRRFITENAKLVPGATELFSKLRAANAEIYVVSEGDSSVQTFKFGSLGLPSLIEECIVTDVTCGAAPIAAELFDDFKDAAHVPAGVERLFDQLSSYSVKSKAFYSKLIHVLVEQNGDLQDGLKSPRFLTKEEWQVTQPHFIVMVGDRYRKDLEPLLQLGPAGIEGYRVLSSRYSREDPLDEILISGKPSPTGVFPDLRSVTPTLIAAIQKEDESMLHRPLPIIPAPGLIAEVLDVWTDMNEDTRTQLKSIQNEGLRHAGGLEWVRLENSPLEP